MLALARCGRHQEAAKMARAMSKSHPKNAPVLFSAATGFAVCAAAAAQREPGKDADPGDALLADQYGKAAVETLQSAVEHGYQLTAEVLLDPDLASLRDRPDARELFKKHRVEP
jgi:hypothetical protein